MIKKYFSLLLCCWAVAVCGEITVKSGDAIAFLGDSITARGVNRSGGYINLTMAALRINGIDARMISAGFGGNKSPDMHARLKRDVLNKKKKAGSWIQRVSLRQNDLHINQKRILFYHIMISTRTHSNDILFLKK